MATTLYAFCKIDRGIGPMVRELIEKMGLERTPYLIVLDM